MTSNDPTAAHYHSGFNMPGYLPEAEPETFATFDEAKAYMIGELNYHADSVSTWADEHDCDDVPCPTYGDDCPNDQASALSLAAEDLNLESGPEWGDIVAGTSYWINVCREPDCGPEDEDEDITRSALESQERNRASLAENDEDDETRARRLASEWHGGQDSALYALASTGTVLPGATLEIREAGGDEDLTWLRAYVAERGPAKPERSSLGPWPKAPKLSRQAFNYLARVLAELEFVADEGRRGPGTVHEYVTQHFAHHLADTCPRFDRDRFVAAATR